LFTNTNHIGWSQYNISN